ncbi:MAG: bifunctional phosphoglucose/phosphomannose isomerase [Patescibacteria group bacterium]|nr:bifunctional phosphoglucose/phosphomannose isomerase [Patescibacteria group bacterium]
MKQIDRALIQAVDLKNMWNLLTGFPHQFEEALELFLKFDFTIPLDDLQNIVLCGMGGSALGGDIVLACLRDELAYPFLVVRGYTLPSFINNKTLVIISSYSGNTTETLATYESAKKRTSKLLCLTSGGELQIRAQRDKIPVLIVPNGRPPRTALGYLIVFLLQSFKRLGIINDKWEDVEETALILKQMLAHYERFDDRGQNQALSLAYELSGKIPVIYGSESTFESVAFRWKTQLTENSKIVAYHNCFPELCHNEYQGWDAGDLLTKLFYLIYLRDAADDDRTKRQIHIVSTTLASRVGGYKEIWSKGKSLLARIMSLIYLGDFTSYYLSILRNVDPTAIPAITELKAKMTAGF